MMTQRLSAAQFEDTPGTGDWRVVWGGSWACTQFATGSFAAGVALVQAIGALAAAAGHAPDVDLRPESVTVRLFSPELHGPGPRDVELARQISAASGVPI